MKIPRWVSLSLLLLAWPSLLRAEQEYESKVPERDTRAARRTEETAEQARNRRLFEAREITLEDILRDPDNVELNILFAKSQIRDGNIRGAASTLERVLLVRPDLAETRMLYAVVLFRLDSLAEAEREFEKAKEMRLPKPLLDEIGGYLGQIKRRRRSTRFAVSEAVGFQIDSNRNAAPSSKKRLFGNALVDLSPADSKQDDTSLLNITGLDVSRDLGFRAGHQWLGSFTYYRAEQTEVDSLDLSSFQGSTGLALKSKWVNATPLFNFSHTRLSGETFLRSQGGRLLLDRPLVKKIDVFAEGSLARQDFTDISENLTVHERRGNQWDGTAGLLFRHAPSASLSAAYTYIDKDAKEEYKAYTGKAAEFAHTWLLGKGQFLLNTLVLERDDYEGPESALAARVRRDKLLRVRTTYGAPLGFFIDEPARYLTGKSVLPRLLRGIVLSASFEYLRSHSNMTNYTYRNEKFSVMLSQRWEF